MDKPFVIPNGAGQPSVYTTGLVRQSTLAGPDFPRLYLDGPVYQRRLLKPHFYQETAVTYLRNCISDHQG